MPPIELNHIWTVVNKPTYAAIKKSPLIKELAYCYEQANSADGQIGWEGFYIRGKNTFIELFFPQERYKSIGLHGIGLGCDHHGDLKKYFHSFKNAYPTAEYQAFTRNGEAWFDYVADNGSYYGDGHSLWIMEYSPDYFQENKEDVSREHYNKASYDPHKLLLDVTGITIALKRSDQMTLSAYLVQSGMESAGSNIFKTHSGITITIINESTSQKGISLIQMALNKSMPSTEPLFIGSSRLEYSGHTANWHFSQ